MNIINEVKDFILNNSIKVNLLRLYLLILVSMSILLVAMIFYSIDLNYNYNRIVLNFANYNKIYTQIDSLDKNIYLNITEQKSFDNKYYNTILKEMNNEITEIGYNIKNEKNIAIIEVLKRTIGTLDKDIKKVELSIINNSDYTSRESILSSIIRTKDLIKSNLHELMELDLNQTQKQIVVIKKQYKLVLFFIIALFIISFIFSLYFLFFVIKDTTNKINIVSESANKLAKGDLSIEHIKFNKYHEFYILATSFNKMKNNIKNYIDQISSNEIKMRSIINNVPFMVWLKDTNGKLLIVNDAYAKMHQDTIENIIGKTDFDFYPKEQAEIFINSDKLVMEEGRTIITEEQVNDSEGEQWHETIKSPIYDNNGKIIGTVGLARDITEKKKVEKMKDEFVSTVSHELRTPLTAIRGALGLILTGSVGEISDKIKNLIVISNNNCLRLSNLINDILDLEKIKAGKYSFIYEELEINTILEQSITLNQSYADQFGMKISLVKNIGEAYIKADKNRLLQVISNLISNAVKFSKINGEVFVISELVNDKIKVSVIDNGIGIPDDSKYKIFQSFSQVDSSDTRAKGGTGLGLSISKLIIENMRGNIGFESETNKGSTFFFTLPSIEKGSFIKDEKDIVKKLDAEEF